MIVCMGELIVDFTAEEAGKSLEEVCLFRKHVGGAPANVAVGLHHHGVPVQLWTKVGHDSFGRFLKSRLRAWGMDVSGILTDRTHPTKLAFVGIDDKGERFFEFHNRDSAERYIEFTELNRRALATTRLFHFGGVALLGDATANTTLKLLPLISQRGGLISFDPNIRMEICHDAGQLRSRISQALRYVNILKLSEDEYDQLFPNKRPTEIMNDQLFLVIITKGERGSMFYTAKESLALPARKTRVVDTTGAGDAFMAALLAKLYRLLPPEGRLILTAKTIRQMGEFAGDWASRIIARPGAVSAYFDPLNEQNAGRQHQEK